ncbi:phage terminase large subunit family protein [Campylobacter sputorum]|uniref:phage terminase large subunit family protein n=1 Tax=Campylobacter sputorum TaxID=206 RepID=UPI00053C04CC|nr:terminase gpA endonuclease subunit [Campylobacter sputorum]
MGKVIDIFANSIFIKPRLNLTQWAEKFRILSKESSSNYGKFKPFSYQIEPMNEISNSKRRKIVLLWASQLGKSEMINNAIGYFIHQEPSTILFMLPNENDTEDYSKRRLAPMFRDCKELNNLINANDNYNTILIKNFKGGNLALVGSNSVSKLASKPIKCLFVDEADRCEVTKEGDSIKLAEKRTITFYDRKTIISSTPTLKGTSTIEQEFLNSDQRYFYVKCPHCGFEQVLNFEHIIWEKGEDGSNDLESVKYECVECGSLWSEQEKNLAVKNGSWIAHNPKSEIAGFFLNAVYSPFFTMKDIAKDFLDSKNSSAKLQTFINTIKAQAYEPPSASFRDDELYSRRELYTKECVPQCVEFITGGVDIQKDRIEVLFTGWAEGFEAYHIEYKQIYGNTDQKEVWEQTLNFLLQPFIKESGTKLNASAVLIDSGYKASEVYKLASMSKTFIATKGLSETSTKSDFLNKVQIKKDVYKYKFMSIGTFKGKSEVFRLLEIKEFGQGYQHYNESFTKEFFLQLTAERLEKTKDKKGYTKYAWIKKRERNEAFDITVLALAGAKLVKQGKKRRIVKR